MLQKKSYNYEAGASKKSHNLRQVLQKKSDNSEAGASKKQKTKKSQITLRQALPKKRRKSDNFEADASKKSQITLWHLWLKSTEQIVTLQLVHPENGGQ